MNVIAKRSNAIFIFIIVLAMSATLLPGKIKEKDLPEKYYKWLTEDVTYIITPLEKAVFLELETPKERDLFIDAFWKNRDPNPNTPENEFMLEHYKRIQYANINFGRGTPTKGWRTEMGRIYIILGMPNSIERYENDTELYPTIVWFYQGFANLGLPDAFSVVFFKKNGAGDYILYSPIKDGPQSLLVHYMGDPKDYESAFDMLQYINPDVAKISLSLIESERRLTMAPSVSSEILISKKIVETPTKKVNDTYASKLLKYKEFIESDYSVNYVESSSAAQVMRDESGAYYVHYLIEPKKLTMEQYEDTFYANLEIDGSIIDEETNLTVYQFNRSVPIKLERDQLEKIQDQLFSFQSQLPLIEGRYIFNILVRNAASKEFTSMEKHVVIPAFDTDKVDISPLILGNRQKSSQQNLDQKKAFVFNNVQYSPSPRNDFSARDTIYLYYQLTGLTDAQKAGGYVKYTIYKDTQELHSIQKKLVEYPDNQNISEEFSLKGYVPAYYKLRVSVYGPTNNFLKLQEADFYISPLSQLPRPWVVSLSENLDASALLNILGVQYFNKKDYKKAYLLLERSYNGKPLNPKYALDFCRILLMANKYDRIKKIAEAFTNPEDKKNFVGMLGVASENLGQYEEAIQNYKSYLEYHGTNIKILNSIGACYLKLGNIDEALVALQKSLELEPTQKDLKAKIEELKAKQEQKK